ncbi:MAG: tyrosine-protein phosphatase [Asticcacaulis sp.]|uniref:tyrosine-protein phosphatase n=1 Tax=Asticcacaulis sp. TaxID=1872648 RepID=UPI0039E244CD
MKISKMMAHVCALALLAAVPAFAAHAFEAPQAVTTADGHIRVLAVAGGNNFRDIGGYATADGHHVKWGTLYRSASLGQVTPEGFAYLKSLGIKTEIDFRSTDERQTDPNIWPADMGVTTYAEDYSNPSSAFAALMSPDVTADKARTMMSSFYAQAPFQFASQYKRMFRQIIDGNTPLVYHCTAGKDRTGVATALILTVLGVSRETATEDYLLSNQYYKPVMPQPGSQASAQMAFFMKLPPDVVKAMMGVDAQYLNSAFNAIDQREGGMARYVHEDLGLTDADVALLKRRLLD